MRPIYPPLNSKKFAERACSLLRHMKCFRLVATLEEFVVARDRKNRAGGLS
jgi:hypothetical protein